MQKHVYEYAVIRVVPKVEREEFLNVGIILFCKSTRFIKVIYKLDISRLACFTDELDVQQIEQNLLSFEKISRGAKDGGPIALQEIPERFRWLTALRSSVIQTSRPHPGLSSDPQMTAEKLFRDLVV